MQPPLLHKVQEQKLWISGERTIFWEEAGALILSDCHFGKTGHFRKAGIAVPQQVYREDLQRLIGQIQYFKPAMLIIVGDLFHSRMNQELEWFRKWREDLPHIRFLLVKGNHDILSRQWYRSANIEVYDDILLMPPFSFSHENCDVPEGYYGFCGHVHPGILLEGIGRQSLRLPCFYFGEDHCIMPAFSRFTGIALIEPKQGENVFALVENKAVQIH